MRKHGLTHRRIGQAVLHFIATDYIKNGEDCPGGGGAAAASKQPLPP
jgi:hypothetical protein